MKKINTIYCICIIDIFKCSWNDFLSLNKNTKIPAFSKFPLQNHQFSLIILAYLKGSLAVWISGYLWFQFLLTSFFKNAHCNPLKLPFWYGILCNSYTIAGSGAARKLNACWNSAEILNHRGILDIQKNFFNRAVCRNRLLIQMESVTKSWHSAPWTQKCV